MKEEHEGSIPGMDTIKRRAAALYIAKARAETKKQQVQPAAATAIAPNGNTEHCKPELTCDTGDSIRWR